MTWTLVAHTTAAAQNGVTTAAINTAGADLLVVLVSQYDGNPVGALSDSQTNTWTGLTARSGTVPYARLYYVHSPSTSASHTFTYSNGGGLDGTVEVQAWSGSGASPFDVENGAVSATSASTVQPGSITPSASNELVVCGLCNTDNSGTATIDSSFTISDHQNWVTGTNEGGALAYLVQTSAMAVNPTWTVGGSPTQDSAAVIASFKGSGGAAATAVNRRTLGPRVGSRSVY